MAPWIPIGSLRSQFQAALLTSWEGLATQGVPLPVPPAPVLLPEPVELPLPVELPPPVVFPVPVLFPAPVVLPAPVVAPPFELPVPEVGLSVPGLAQPTTKREPSKQPNHARPKLARRRGAYARIKSSLSAVQANPRAKEGSTQPRGTGTSCSRQAVATDAARWQFRLSHPDAQGG